MTSTTTAVPTVWPTFVCRDPPPSCASSWTPSGFAERAVYGDPLEHAELTWAAPDGAVAGGVMFGPDRPDDLCGQPPGGASVHVVVTAPDTGSRQFVVRDPEGNVWSFGTWYG